ncbi:MAG: HEAT repeat domain-containing protein [candidate division KSB1 bacterium]|nr:HEAT repeat domain-containing protein [candidate division KSB1 bacterium]MDZ7317608.1 HEAT repeat domain-containing protein [candidate division KSB1 bacterium]
MKTRSKFVVAAVLALWTMMFVGGTAWPNEPAVSDYDQYLINSLKDENVGIRTSAAQLLGERKTEAAVMPLVKMIKVEKSYAARIVAAMALYQIGDEKALPCLKSVAKKDKNQTVRHVAAGIVRQMQEKEYTQK